MLVMEESCLELDVEEFPLVATVSVLFFTLLIMSCAAYRLERVDLREVAPVLQEAMYLIVASS